jgi:hypothetical protein
MNTLLPDHATEPVVSCASEGYTMMGCGAVVEESSIEGNVHGRKRLLVTI